MKNFSKQNLSTNFCGFSFWKNLLIIFASSFSLVFFSAQNIFAEENFQKVIWYRLKYRDSLGKILFDLGISPLWGERGFVKRTLHINRNLISNGDELPNSGTWIRLPLPEDWNHPVPDDYHSRLRFVDIATIDVNESVSPAKEDTQPHPKEKEQESIVALQTSKEKIVPPSSNAILWYQIQKGDELGTLLHKLNIGPLWGANGYVQKTIALNKLSSRNELPEIGTWIKLPIPKESDWEIPSEYLAIVRWENKYKKDFYDLLEEATAPHQEKEFVGPLEFVGPSFQVTETVEVERSKEAKTFWYQIQKGDELGSLLYKLNIGPLWGANGYVQKTIELNNFKSSNNLPEIGTWIQLPFPQKSDWEVPSQFSSITLWKGEEKEVTIEEKVDVASKELGPHFYDLVEEAIKQPPQQEEDGKITLNRIDDENIETDDDVPQDIFFPAEVVKKFETEETPLSFVGPHEFVGPIPQVKRQIASSDVTTNEETTPLEFVGPQEFVGPIFQKLENSTKTEAKTLWYQIQKGDELGSLLYKLNIGPLWGSHGYVQKTIQLNAFKSSSDLPEIGVWIQLPFPQKDDWEVPSQFVNITQWKGVEKEITKEEKIEVVNEELGPHFYDLIADAIKQPLEETKEAALPFVGPHEFVGPLLQENRSVANFIDETEDPNLYEDSDATVLDDTSNIEADSNTDEAQPPLPTSLPEKKVAAEEQGSSLIIMPDSPSLTTDLKLDALKDTSVLQITPEMLESIKKAIIDEVRAELKDEIIAELKKEFMSIKEGNESSSLAFLAKPVDRTPQAVTVMDTKVFNKDWGTFGVSPGLFSTRLTSTDLTENADVNLAASLHTSVSIDWQKTLVDNWTLLADAHFGLLKYNAPNNFELTSNSSFMMTFGTGIRYSWTDKLFTDLKGGLGSLQVLGAISTSAVTVEKANVPYGQGSIRYEGIYYGPLALSVEAGAKMYLGGSGDTVTVDGGFGGYFLIDQRIVVNENNVVGGAFIYDLGSIDTSNSTNSLTSTGAKVFWIWKP